MGISLGWGDTYTPNLAFQAIDVTDLPVGSYRLCATVNANSMWTEKADNHANNSYWMDLEIDAANNQLTPTSSGTTPC